MIGKYCMFVYVCVWLFSEVIMGLPVFVFGIFCSCQHP